MQSVRKGKSRGVFKEHELYSNSYEQKARPHQLHPMLGCHRHSWKEKSLVKKVTPSSPFNWIPYFQPLSLPPILPLRSHLVNRKADVWQLHGHKNEVKIVWLRRIAAERFFFLLGEIRRASRKKTSLRRSEPLEWALTLIFSSLMFFDSRDGFCRKVGTARNIVLYRRLR